MRKSTIIAFVFGAAVGAAGAWQYAKKKYEQLAQEEIDSVKTKFAENSKYEGPNDSDEEARIKAQQARNKPDITAYESVLVGAGYTDYTAIGEQKATKASKPYVISPDEFAANDDFTKISLRYYADQVLADDDDTIIENVEEIVGYESLTHFGEYSDDCVFVRNERLKCDYEILLDEETYESFLERNPYKAEV